MVRKIQVYEDWEEDIRIWPLTSDGGYSVRSVYRMLVDAEILPLPSSSIPTSAGSVWKKIWKVQVSNKIRHFLWHAAKDSLPTKQNLEARHIPVGNVCDGCGDHTKSVLFSGGSCFCIMLFATVAWSLWQRRNKVRECQPVWLLHEMEDRARTLVAELWDVIPQEQREPMRRPQVRQSPPPKYYYKANFDAAFFEESGSVGVGVVYRDHTGQVIEALQQNIGSVQSVEMAEALAT
ncbi:uncharacterized protein LOC142632628 [Castanea sativa]|uniref:uncharacterized protein LOC142632628 n=1 Tax=Castanea sativa TaxID=21020 RepID=UPI003F64F139